MVLMKERSKVGAQVSVVDEWSLTEEIQRKIDEAKKSIDKSEMEFMKLVIPSPRDGSPSRFVRFEGAHGRVRAVFRSESGNEFYVG